LVLKEALQVALTSIVSLIAFFICCEVHDGSACAPPSGSCFFFFQQEKIVEQLLFVKTYKEKRKRKAVRYMLFINNTSQYHESELNFNKNSFINTCIAARNHPPNHSLPEATFVVCRTCILSWFKILEQLSKGKF
jgi:hypothetical protein